jgi:hypothetical protein
MGHFPSLSVCRLFIRQGDHATNMAAFICARSKWDGRLALFHFFHRLKLAQTAACAFLHPAAKCLQNANGINAAQLAGAGAIGKTLLET